MKILILYRKGSASDYHRIFNPFRYLPLESGEEVVYMTEDDQYQTGNFKNVDLVIFNRHPTVDIKTFLEMKDRYKFKVWCDVDDSWELYENHYLHDDWKKNKVAEMILSSMNNADIVTVTNKRLLRKVLPINHKVQIIPNALPIGHEQFTSNKTESVKLRFMYAGGPSHYHDLTTIEEFFKLVNMNVNFKVKTQFTLAGFKDTYIGKPIHQMNQMMKMTPNYKTREILPLHEYMQHYNYTDVALAPLENNEFNTFKSNLKIIEAGCMKTPIIVSKMYPFLEDEEMDNKGVYFCNSTSDWLKAARTLMDNPTLVIDDAERLHEYVRKNYDLIKVNQIRRQIINSFK